MNINKPTGLAIKVNGNLPHPNKAGFAVINPILLVLYSYTPFNIQLIIEAYLTANDITPDGKKKIGNEQYTDIKPIPFFIYRGIERSTNEAIIFKSVTNRNSTPFINEIPTPVLYQYGVPMDDSEPILISETIGEVKTEFYDLEKMPITDLDNTGANCIDKMTQYCCKMVIDAMNEKYADLVKNNELSFEIINLEIID